MPQPARYGPKVGVLLLLILAANGCDKTYDLRGPARKKGDCIHIEETSRIQDGAATITNTAGAHLGRRTYQTDSDSTHEVERVTDGAVTMFLEFVTRDRDSGWWEFEGKRTPDISESPLESMSVRHTLTGAKWSRDLVTAKRSLVLMEPRGSDQEQQRAAENRSSTALTGFSYPSEPVRVGHRWTEDASALRRQLGIELLTFSGSASMHFKNVVEKDGETQAVIDVVVEMKGRGLDSSRNEFALEMGMTGTIHRSLATGLDRSSSLTGQMVSEGLQTSEEDGQVHFRVQGPFTYTSKQSLMPSLPTAVPKMPFVPKLPPAAPKKSFWQNPLLILGALLLIHFVRYWFRRVDSQGIAQGEKPQSKRNE